MSTVQVTLPDDTFSAVRRSPEEVAAEMRVAVAVRWYADGRLSQGKAAEVAGLSRSAFIDALNASGVSPFQETLEEIRGVLAGD